MHEEERGESELEEETVLPDMVMDLDFILNIRETTGGFQVG